MAQGDDQERSERATPKRREEARKKGQVASSRDLTSVAVMSGALAVLFFSGGWMLDRLFDIFRIWLSALSSAPILEASAQDILLKVFGQTAALLMPLFLLLTLVAVGVNALQVGFYITFDPLSPDLSKLDPIRGLKKFVSLKTVVDMVKALLKISLVAGVAYLVLKKQIGAIPGLTGLDAGDLLSFIGRAGFQVCLYTCLALLALAGLDYGYQRWRFERDLRMTKQEVKEEFRQREGDPLIKSRIRKVMFEMSRRRMMDMVPQADVVITNPTHLAIALKFDAETMAAPKVVAKGAGFVAEKIREISKAHRIPLVENKPLARALFKSVEIGNAIPVELYQAVAEVLAYVYRLKGYRRPV